MLNVPLTYLGNRALQVEARFEPLFEKYKTLEKFEVQVTEQEQLLVEKLPGEWASFQQVPFTS